MQLFRWEAPCWDPAWQEALDRLAPPTERGPSSLLLGWLPEVRGVPVQRFVVYQCLPMRRLPFLVDDDVHAALSREQWRIYRKTGCYAQTYWVLQGPPGGHRRVVRDDEQTLVELVGTSPPPMPGQAPYRPFTPLVVERLRVHDALVRYTGSADFLDRDLDAEAQAERHRIRGEYWDLWGEQLDESLQLTHDQVSHVRDEWKRIGKNTSAEPLAADELDTDAGREAFITAED